MRSTSLIMICLVLAVSINAVDWTGATNTNWNLGSNWSSGVVPTSTTDVNIPVNVYGRYPVTSSAEGYCRHLVVQTGTWVSVHQFNLNVSGNATFYGTLNMNQPTDLWVWGNFVWGSGSTVNIVDSAAEIYCYGNMTFNSGSNVQMAWGVVRFRGSTDSNIINHSAATVFHALFSEKSGGAGLYIAATSTQDFTIDALFTNTLNSSSYFQYAGNITINYNFIDDRNSGPGVQCNAGTLIFNGTNRFIALNSTDDYLNHVVASHTGNLTLQTDITIKGNLTLQSGTLQPNSHNIRIGGNWNNTVGSGAFNEGSGTERVIFNGTVDQTIQSSENFNILEINKTIPAGKNLLINNAAVSVTCNAYDWTAGKVYVSNGVFDALSLADNGIAGEIQCSSSGTINLRNPGGWVDLKGTLTISHYNSTVNVYGGTTASYWPYGGNATLTMSSGQLIFHDQGVFVYNSATWSFTENITGGTIKVARGFEVQRADFTPTGGEIEFTGTIDGNISMVSGANFHNIRISKSTARSDDGYGEDLSETDRWGVVHPVTRTGNVNAASNLLLNSMAIQSGILNASGNTIEIKGFWDNTAGPAAFIETGSRVIFSSTTDQYCYYSEDFDTLEINKPAGFLNFSITSSVFNINHYDWTTGGMKVYCQVNILDLVDNGMFGSFNCYTTGTLNITNNDGFIDLNGSLLIDNGTVNIYGGTADCDWAWSSNASITMTNGSLIYHDRGIRYLYATYTLTTNITGGEIRTPGSFYMQQNGFHPSGGTLKMIGGNDVVLSVTNGSYLHNLTVYKTSSRDEGAGSSFAYDREGNLREITRSNTVITNTYSNLTVHGNVEVQAGTLINSSTIYVGGNWYVVAGFGNYTDTSGTVELNGSADQAVGNTNFNILRLNKSGGAMTLSGTVQCNNYDWEAGNLTVSDHSFTALDMVDEHLRGVITVNGGQLVFNQDSGQYLDLGGTLNISSGALTINGGWGPMYWPYTYPAAINMNGGAFNINDMGVYLYATPGLTENITGGTITVRGGITGTRTDFHPTGGTFIFVGSQDFYAGLPSGSTLHHVIINKGSTREAGFTSTHYSSRDGSIQPLTRANTILLNNNLTVTGNFTIQTGSFNPNGFTLTVNGNLDIYGTIVSSFSASQITALGNIHWYYGSQAAMSQGTLATYGNWTISNGADVILPAAVLTIMHIPGGVAQAVEILDPSARMGSLEINGMDTYYSGQPLILNGYLTINTTGRLFLGNNLTVEGNLNLNGQLSISSRTGIVHGKVITGASSQLNVTSGSFTCDNSSIPRNSYVNGLFSLTTGVIDYVNNTLTVNPGGSISMSGGELKCDGLSVAVGGTFQPTGGTVEINSNPSNAHVTISFSPGNYFHHLKLVHNQGLILASDLRINGELTIQSGTIDLSTSNYTIDLYGNWTNTTGLSRLIKREGTVRLLGNSSCTFTGADEQFYNLVLNKTGGALLILNSPSNNLSCDHYDWTSGGLQISSGSFTAADLIDHGLYGSYYITGGMVQLTNNDGLVDINGDVTILDGELHIHGGTDDSWWAFESNASITMSGGLLDFHDTGIYMPLTSYSFTTNISGGLIRSASCFIGQRSGFAPTGGVVELYGSTTSNFGFDSTVSSHFYNLRISKPNPRTPVPQRLHSRLELPVNRINDALLYYDTVITNDLHLYQGILDLNEHQLTVMGNMTIDNAELKSNHPSARLTILGNMTWNPGSHASFDNGIIKLHGDLTFNDGTDVALGGFIHFEGDSNSTIHCHDADASLGNLVLYKTGSIQYYIDVFNSADNGLRVNGALIAYNQNCMRTYGTNILVLGDLSLQPGSELRIASGSPVITLAGTVMITDTACITQVLGTMPFISFYGDLYDQNTILGSNRGFNITVADIYFIGSNVQTIVCPRSYLTLPGFRVNKTGGSFAPQTGIYILQHVQILNGTWADGTPGLSHSIEGNLSISDTGIYIPTPGSQFTFTGSGNSYLSDSSAGSSFSTLRLDKTSTANTLNLYSPLRLDPGGTLSVLKGTFFANGHQISNQGATVIGDGGVLQLGSGSILETGSGGVVSVNSGGMLHCAGVMGNNVILRPYSGNWSLLAMAGATVSFAHTTFLGTQNLGVQIEPGAMVDPAGSFANCTFQNGAAGSSYLTINSGQDLVIPNAAFLSLLIGSHNVSKTFDSGSVTLNGASGPFAGPAYENDPYNRIHWAGFLPNLVITAFSCSHPNPYIGDLVSYSVTVLNDSDTPTGAPFNVHLFKNRTPAPGFGELGDVFHTFAPLAAYASASYTYTGIYSMVAEDWTSYALIDPEEAIAEIDETDNRSLPLSVAWQALPAVSDAAINLIGSDIHLSWTYPIPVNRFRIYWDEDPYGSFSSLEGISPVPSYTLPAGVIAWRFFRIKAERDEPTP